MKTTKSAYNKKERSDCMAKRSRYLDINRKRHGVVWWILIGWWERPIATLFWYVSASILGFKGLKFHYYN